MVKAMSTKRNKSYSELSHLHDFLERFRYLQLHGDVGENTFGVERYLNQALYKSKEWRDVRNLVIVRDEGCDLGIEGYEIRDRILIHHINPITVEDVENSSSLLFDPDNLICVSHLTHNAIHYGDESLLPKPVVIRVAGDTCPWR